jgi:hypothetical protein
MTLRAYAPSNGPLNPRLEFFLADQAPNYQMAFEMLSTSVSLHSNRPQPKSSEQQHHLYLQYLLSRIPSRRAALTSRSGVLRAYDRPTPPPDLVVHP